MKTNLALAFIFTVVFGVCGATHAADETTVEEKTEVKSDGDKQEFKMKITKKNDKYVTTYKDREYVLRGEPVTTIKTDGDYVVRGRIVDDGHYIETTEIHPVTVEERHVVKRPVEVEVKKDPIFKAGPLEIRP